MNDYIEKRRKFEINRYLERLIIKIMKDNNISKIKIEPTFFVEESNEYLFEVRQPNGEIHIEILGDKENE